MQHEDHRTEAMHELAAAIACIRRASVHLHASGDITPDGREVASMSMSGLLDASERWCVESLVAINARASVHADQPATMHAGSPVHA